VIDGQHRRAALIIKGLGEEPIPCNVWVEETVQGDAKRFISKNAKNRRPNPIDTFRVNVVAGDKESVAIQEILDRFGLRLTWGAGMNEVSAIAAIQWVYRRGGTSLLVRTFTLVEATWGRERSARDGNILKAIALLLDKVGNQLDLASFADKVSKDSMPGKVLGTARTHRMATGKALYLQCADVLLTIYNRARTTRRVSI
jgi:hypothetical protein